MLLLSAAIAAGFICVNPHAADGATLRCSGRATALHLQGVGAPPSASVCRPGEDCALDPGIGARQRLTAFIESGDVVCIGAAGNSARCYASGIDLSCAMLDGSGNARKAAALGCASEAAGGITAKTGARTFMQLPPLWRWVPLYLMAANIIAYLAFIVDLERARTGLNRIAKPHLLTLVVLGGGIGAAAGHSKFVDLPGENGFGVQLYAVIGLQIGAIAGWILLTSGHLPA